MLRRLGVCSLMGLALLVSARALPTVVRAGGVAGRLTDGRDPVAGADVHLRPAGAGAGVREFRVVSDTGGRFAFSDVPAGAWAVEVRRLGYRPHSQSVTVRDGGVTRLAIELKLAPHRLDTVAVTARGAAPARYGPSSRMDDFYYRRARGRGVFFTREDIEASGRMQLLDLLRQVPGARVVTAPGGLADVTFARCLGHATLARSGKLEDIAWGKTGGRAPMTQLYVDGVRVKSDTIAAQETLGSLGLSEVEAVEVYRGPSELPVEAMGDACAAIFVWTRFGPGEPKTPQ